MGMEVKVCCDLKKDPTQQELYPNLDARCGGFSARPNAEDAMMTMIMGVEHPAAKYVCVVLCGW